MTRVALVQVASPDHESQPDRIERVEALLRSYADVDMFALPELWSPGYFAFEEYAERAETLSGPTVHMAQRVARDLGAAIHLGSIIERDATGKLFNTAVLVGATGEITQTYRKVHVFGYESLEAQLLTPGAQLEVVESPAGRLASTTCYDLRFPGLWQELSDRGAEAVAVPAAWPAPRRRHWQVLTQARAIEHQLFVCAVGACGAQRGVELSGASRIVDPWGEVLVECSYTDEEVAVCDIDPSLVGRVRAEFPVLRDRLGAEEYRRLSSGR